MSRRNIPWLRLFFCSLLLTVLPAAATPFDPGEDPPYSGAVLVEAQTGTVLFAHRPDAPRSPASTQKLLLQLVVMDLVKAGKFSLGEPVITSGRASRMGGSQVYLKEGESFSLGAMLEAMQARWRPSGPGFMHTHPSPGDRLADVSPRLTPLPPVDRPAPRQARFDAAVAGAAR